MRLTRAMKFSAASRAVAAGQIRFVESMGLRIRFVSGGFGVTPKRLPKPVRFVQYPIERGGGWAIYAGVSKFLVAEGSGWSAPVGRALFHKIKTPPAR